VVAPSTSEAEASSKTWLIVILIIVCLLLLVMLVVTIFKASGAKKDVKNPEYKVA